MSRLDAATWRARLHFAQLAQDCMTGALRGDWHVNDLPRYVEEQREAIRASIAGEHDYSFTFRQMEHYFRTGEMVPLLG